MRDIYHNTKVEQVLDPLVATGTQTSATIDLQGYDAAQVIISVGESGDTLSGSVKWDFKLQDSDNDSDYEDVAVGDLHNAVATQTIDAAAEDDTALVFGYKGSKRYLQAVATATGSHSNGTPMAITAILAAPAQAPVA